MKRLVLLLLVAAGVTAAATEITQAVKELNAAIEQLIAPLRNETTEAHLNFSDVQTNNERALAVAMDARFKKTGPANTAELRIDKLAYTYGDGTAPTTQLKGFLGLDLTKLIRQEQLNQIIPGLEDIVQSIANDFTRQFGEAATVKFEVLSRDKDAAGNFTAVKAMLYAEIDLSKLPQSVKLEDVPVKIVSAEVSADLKVGLNVNAVVTSNPAFKGFNKDNKGLKEGLDALLTKDPQILGEIQKLFTDLNEAANRIVSGQGF